MKKYLLLFLFLFSIPSVISQECDFTRIVNYTVDGDLLFYQNTETPFNDGKGLVLSDFLKGNLTTSFIAYNPNDFDVTAKFNFTIDGWTDESYKDYAKLIGARKSEILRELCYKQEKFGNCSINEDSVQYTVLIPESVYHKLAAVTKTKEECVICSTLSMQYCDEIKDCLVPQSKNLDQVYSCDFECKSGLKGKNGICRLEDGESCTKPSDCFSNECNPARKCGKFTSCQNGTQLCNSSNSCVAPSIKEIRQEYNCEWECKSQRGSNGICEIGIRPLIFYLSVISLLIGIGVYLTTKYSSTTWRNKEITKANKEAEKIINIAKTNADSIINASKDKANSVLQQADDKAEKNKNNARQLKQEAKEIREKAELKLREIEDSDTILRIKEKAEKEAKAKIDEANKLASEALSNNIYAEKQAARIKEEAKKIASKMVEDAKEVARNEAEKIKFEDKYWKELINWKGEGRLIKDSDGYPIWKNGGNLFHVEYYKEQYKERYGKEIPPSREIHHIDNIKTNFHFENLIDLSYAEHGKIAHSRISINGGFEQGIKVLLECLKWDESQLPEHIKEEIKRRKN